MDQTGRARPAALLDRDHELERIRATLRPSRVQESAGPGAVRGLAGLEVGEA